MDKLSFIRDQLAKLGEVEMSGEQAKMLCPFHDDSRPSLDISLINIPGKVSIGGFNCFACKEHGGWNKLAGKLGLEFWNKRDAEKTPHNEASSLAQDIEQLKKHQQIQYRKPVTEGPWEGEWRGLSGSFLRSIGCEVYWDREFEEYRLYLPIHSNQKLVGHVLARGENSDIPDGKKYLNSFGFDAMKYWYCLNYEKHPKALVIVEGPFDTLRFRSFGIPAIGAFGAGQLSSMKIMQVVAKGCREIVLALDADTAGRTASADFYQAFTAVGCHVVDLNLTQYLPKLPNGDTDLDSKMDPGSCPIEVIDDLKRYLASIQ